MPSLQRGPEQRRRALCSETILGFLGTFAVLATLQSICNLFQPQPRIWPGMLAVALIIATVSWWRHHRSHYCAAREAQRSGSN